MEQLTFGVEIEVVANRRKVADLIGNLIGASVKTVDEETYRVGTEPNHWDIVMDDSIDAVPDCQTEIVSPILSDFVKDLGEVKRIATALTQSGAKVNDTCGLHVHIGIPDEDRLCLLLIPLIMRYLEFRFYTAFGVTERRREFAKPLSPEFLRKLEEIVKNMSPLGNVEEIVEQIKNAWYETEASRRPLDRYDESRYRGLNIHSYFYRGTIEFRYFNSSLREDVIERCVIASRAVVDLGRALITPPGGQD